MKRLPAITLVVCAVSMAARADTFVVLPFFNQTNSANLDWIGESLSEITREALASEGLLTLDREDRIEAYHRLSLRPYALLTKGSVIKIGETLDAEHVIYGRFDLKPAASGEPAARGSLQITASILDLKHLRQTPDYSEVGSLEDLAILQRHLAYQTLTLVAPRSAPSEEEFNGRHPAVRVDAIENYIRGLLAAAPAEKHRLFTQAARLDARFSQPCFQLGKLSWQSKDFKVAEEWLQKVSSADVHYREANFLLGLCRYQSGDFAGAQEAFQLVARTVPLNEVLNNLGAAASRRSQPEALDDFRKAMEGDPSDPDYQFNTGYALWKKGDFDAAAERFRAVLARDPRDSEANTMLGRCLSRNGPRPGDTKTEGLERLKTSYEESAWWQLQAALQPAKP
ncbi:MAG TPA: tetratricopeptide repeat protein [Bryobacteraceae bacterium]|nr:tetratricopeptide repeat protein [Bryobacteraceae bacterium]